jgi:hypothetical protein
MRTVSRREGPAFATHARLSADPPETGDRITDLAPDSFADPRSTAGLQALRW